MKFTTLLPTAALLAGCATHRDDARLQGTWISNRDATVGAAFERDPRWTSASPEKVQQFKDFFGHMTVTFSHGIETANCDGAVCLFDYHLVKQGTDYVIIRDDAPMRDGQDIRIRFVDGNTGCWIDTWPVGLENQERFDKVTARKPTTEPATAAH